MIELEKKVLITEEEYYTLLKHFKVSKTPSLQINYYFDTDDYSMNKKGITYRIRAKNNGFVATIKEHQNRDCSIEQNVGISSTFNPRIFEDIGLSLQGNLITERSVLFKNNYCKVVLDKNTYLGIIDFELEIEYLETFEKIAFSKLNKIGNVLVSKGIICSNEKFVKRIGKSKNKSERFFSRKQK